MTNLVLITSIIDPPQKPLSYTNTRSVYTKNERFNQTKKTISSIKEKIPNLKIFIIECSQLDEEETSYFIENSDYFLNLYSNEQIRSNIYSISKSLGEGTMTIAALNFIIKNNIDYKNLIKISGRYWLSENFDYLHFNNDNIVVKYIEGNIINVFTALYKLPKNIVNEFFNFLKNSFDDMVNCIGYENLFGKFIATLNNRNITVLENIGLQGFVSISNEFYNG